MSETLRDGGENSDSRVPRSEPPPPPSPHHHIDEYHQYAPWDSSSSNRPSGRPPPPFTTTLQYYHNGGHRHSTQAHDGMNPAYRPNVPPYTAMRPYPPSPYHPPYPPLNPVRSNSSSNQLPPPPDFPPLPPPPQESNHWSSSSSYHHAYQRPSNTLPPPNLWPHNYLHRSPYHPHPRDRRLSDSTPPTLAPQHVSKSHDDAQGGIASHALEGTSSSTAEDGKMETIMVTRQQRRDCETIRNAHAPQSHAGLGARARYNALEFGNDIIVASDTARRLMERQEEEAKGSLKSFHQAAKGVNDTLHELRSYCKEVLGSDEMDLIRSKRLKMGNEGEREVKRRKSRKSEVATRCQSCQTTETPEWRRGPHGRRTLCNACGLIYAKLKKDRGGAIKAGDLSAIDHGPDELLASLRRAGAVRRMSSDGNLVSTVRDGSVTDETDGWSERRESVGAEGEEAGMGRRGSLEGGFGRRGSLASIGSQGVMDEGRSFPKQSE
ncbi:hypothetical protein BC829DRAFT_451949 [Chytridium lagenaria]|nr:hypothetical protein BC829DRAFT_451949 [Chytridium lagenaria]